MHGSMHTAIWLAAIGSTLAVAAAAEPPFELRELPAPGRTAAAGFADLDGDGRTDVFSVGLSGVPPTARRVLRIHFQTADGRLPGIPDWSGEVLDGAAAFDLADLPDGPGQELLLLVRNGVSVLSFPDRRLQRREIELSGGPTVAFAPDERGLDQLRIARNGFREGTLLLVPQLGDLSVLRPDGTLLGRFDVGHRANFFVPPRPGALVGENEIEQFYDFPRIDVCDVDGDGRQDVIATHRHEIRAFRRREDGSFDSQPSPSIAIGLLTEKDMIRSSTANVRVAPADLDGDGRCDLLLSHVSGGFLDARTVTTVHLNRGGTWNLSQPDQRFVAEKRWNAWQLLDLDGDGREEIIEAQIRLSVLELVEVLVTRSIDGDIKIRRHADGDVPFGEKPWITRKISLGIDFNTFEPKGFIPTFAADMNGDGFRDSLSSGGGKAIEISLGGGKKPWDERAARQELDTTGRLRLGDLDGDGLTDFLIYDRTREGTPLRIGRNRGVLPGTRLPQELHRADDD